MDRSLASRKQLTFGFVLVVTTLVFGLFADRAIPLSAVLQVERVSPRTMGFLGIQSPHVVGLAHDVVPDGGKAKMGRVNAASILTGVMHNATDWNRPEGNEVRNSVSSPVLSSQSYDPVAVFVEMIRPDDTLPFGLGCSLKTLQLCGG